MPPFGKGIDADGVRALFLDGVGTAAIAAAHGVGQRRVQQLVADLRPKPLAEPDDDELEALIIDQRRRLGSSYGTQMMEGALHEAYPHLWYVPVKRHRGEPGHTRDVPVSSPASLPAFFMKAFMLSPHSIHFPGKKTPGGAGTHTVFPGVAP